MDLYVLIRDGHLEVVPYYTYLGAFFTSLFWNKTKETLSQQASKADVNILKYQKQFGYFYANEALKLFDSSVVPMYATLLMFGVTNIRNVSNEWNPTFVNVYAALINTCQIVLLSMNVDDNHCQVYTWLDVLNIGLNLPQCLAIDIQDKHITCYD